ncbi:hypothetical protein MN116_002703 [Schistosoma mekongi]|uniref:Etoposide-induced protein 2.4 n=1 Tax=Schistosoma mekongi TaxID=38744 RepID=A0AAE2D687_SCHME|nr:hypothetical protein MN116_002703 [Schistosoma mekongi]
MSSLKYFMLGFQEFLTTPIRLWRMHYHLTQFMSSYVHNTKIHEHQRERQKRLEIRIPSSDRLASTTSQIEQSSSCVDKLPESNIDSTISSSLSSSLSSSSTPTSQIKRSSSDSQGLLEPLASMWLINVGLILVLAILSYCFSLISLTPSLVSWFESSRFCQFVQRLFSCSVHIALLLFMELVNLLYLKKICDRIILLSMTKEYRYIQRTSTRSSILFTGFSNLPSIDRSNYFLNSAIGGTIMDRLYTLIFFVIFQLQWNLLATLSANYCIGNVINAFSVAFLYACYAFEYRWRQVTGTTFEGFLGRIVDNWTYFLGYGLPLGCASIIFPHFIGWGGVILAIGYPVLVIGALGSRWHPFDVSINVKDEWKVFRLLRYCLIISLRPALWVSNLVVQTSAWFVYQFLFRQNYSVGSNHDEDENNTGICRSSSTRRRHF